MPTPIQLVVGLGNPGSQYERTRHNAGVWLTEALTHRHQLTLSPEKKFLGSYSKMRIGSNNLHFLVPSTFMNNSGQSVKAITHFYKIPTDAILVLHDELDLPVGQVKLKRGGGHAGHNGLRSIIQHLGSADFWRFRVGIGHPGHRDKVSSFVLNTPSVADRIQIDRSIDNAVDVFDCLFDGEFEKAMRQLHTKE